MSSFSESISQLSTTSADFEKQLDSALDRGMLVADEVNKAVSNIIGRVRSEGDRAVLDYTNQFDGLGITSPTDLIVTTEQLQAALRA